MLTHSEFTDVGAPFRTFAHGFTWERHNRNSCAAKLCATWVGLSGVSSNVDISDQGQEILTWLDQSRILVGKPQEACTLKYHEMSTSHKLKSSKYLYLQCVKLKAASSLTNGARLQKAWWRTRFHPGPRMAYLKIICPLARRCSHRFQWHHVWSCYTTGVQFGSPILFLQSFAACLPF